MIYSDAVVFQHIAEVWDEKTCAKKSKHRAKDGCGTKYPFLGYIGQGGGRPYGLIRYNGGCERNGQWWQGENRPLPSIHPDYEIIFVSTWGYRIRKKGDK